jgi:hypothetical protein
MISSQGQKIANKKMKKKNSQEEDFKDSRREGEEGKEEIK